VNSDLVEAAGHVAERIEDPLKAAFAWLQIARTGDSLISEGEWRIQYSDFP